MSRSYRKTPILGHGGGSEKQDKRIYNRCLRTRVRQLLRSSGDFDALVLPEVRDVSNPWSMNKDGKSFADGLARFQATLEKVVRVRGGSRRWQLVITEATVELAQARNRQFALRFSRLFGEDAWVDAQVARRDAPSYIEELRK